MGSQVWVKIYGQKSWRRVPFLSKGTAHAMIQKYKSSDVYREENSLVELGFISQNTYEGAWDRIGRRHTFMRLITRVLNKSLWDLEKKLVTVVSETYPM